MTQLSREEVNMMTKHLESILNQTVEDKKAVKSIYSFVDSRKDARITVFSKLVDVFRSTQLSLIFVSKHLMDKDWWRDICKNPIPDMGPKSFITGFGRFMKFGLVHGIFSCVESSLRVFLRALDPTACSGGLDNFNNIYISLFQSKLAKCPPDGVKLLDLFRLIRNTIHNNGVYFHKDKKNQSIRWKGTDYKFKHGHPVQGITLDFIITISDDVRSLLLTIVQDSKLKAITHEVTDPAGPYGP